MKPCDLSIEAGRVVQMLPSFIRSMCRARFEYDADELLDEHRERAAAYIEQSPVYGRYQFTKHHAAALRHTALSELRALILKQVTRQQMRLSCPYLRDPKKRSCWSCPVARAVVLELIGGEDEQTIENNNE